ncbi:3768_t:CDS:2, partial [Paraglomus brasilianum]
NWITNEKAKHKPTAPRRPTTRTRIQTTKRALSGYNVFMKEFFQKTNIDDYLKEHTDIIIEGLEGLKKTNRIAGYAWHNLSASEKDRYRERANQLAQKIKM